MYRIPKSTDILPMDVEDDVRFIECGNCGVDRFVKYPIVEKCWNCGDEEYDLSEPLPQIP